MLVKPLESRDSLTNGSHNSEAECIWENVRQIDRVETDLVSIGSLVTTFSCANFVYKPSTEYSVRSPSAGKMQTMNSNVEREMAVHYTFQIVGFWESAHCAAHNRKVFGSEMKAIFTCYFK